jgi:hypothetical protein
MQYVVSGQTGRLFRLYTKVRKKSVGKIRTPPQIESLYYIPPQSTPIILLYPDVLIPSADARTRLPSRDWHGLPNLNVSF